MEFKSFQSEHYIYQVAKLKKGGITYDGKNLSITREDGNGKDYSEFLNPNTPYYSIFSIISDSKNKLTLRTKCFPHAHKIKVVDNKIIFPVGKGYFEGSLKAGTPVTLKFEAGEIPVPTKIESFRLKFKI